jgi:hypothetical protein
MGYDKDWEVYLALDDPNDPIHGYIEDQIEVDKNKDADLTQIEEKKQTKERK